MTKCMYKEKQMSNRINSLGGVHFEKDRGYRATLTLNGNLVRSQRVKTQREANRILNRIRKAIGRNLNIYSNEMSKLVINGVVTITL